MDDDETKIFKTETAFRQKIEDALLDVLKASDIDGVSPRIVIKAFDDGQLRGIRMGTRMVRINCRALLEMASG